MERLYTVEDVAKFTNLTTRTIRNYLKDGLLKGRKIGGQWRFTMGDIHALLNDKHARHDMMDTHDQCLLDFVNGINTDIGGELQVCSVADYYCPSMEETARLNERFDGAVCTRECGGQDFRYYYYYSEKEQKARYIFFGQPQQLKGVMDILQDVWKGIHFNHTYFSGKASLYQKGRPDYPDAFMEYLYTTLSITKQDTIADIGAGTGKVSRLFLERGNKVLCVEPNADMLGALQETLGHYKYCVPILKPAEDTGIASNAVDYILCGNAYDYFDRALVKTEFRRILRKNGKVIITYYGPVQTPYGADVERLNRQYIQPAESSISDKKRDHSNAFAAGKYEEKLFEHTYSEGLDRFLAGVMSFSGAPKPGDAHYEVYYKGLREIFEKHQQNGQLCNTFRLRCQIGDVNDLA